MPSHPPLFRPHFALSLCLTHVPCLFAPPPQAHTGHLQLPCPATGLRAQGGSGSKSALLAVPNVVSVLRELREIGEGLVDDALPVRSCARLPLA